MKSPEELHAFDVGYHAGLVRACHSISVLADKDFRSIAIKSYASLISDMEMAGLKIPEFKSPMDLVSSHSEMLEYLESK